MFSIHDFIMSCLHGMVHCYPDFQVREYALNWYGKGKITEEDLALVEEWLTVVEVPEDPEDSDVPEVTEDEEPVDSEESEVNE